MSLIVVESPTKARTFNRILKMKEMDGEYEVFATVGHFRDLPADKIAIDYTHQFQPQYHIMDKKQKVVDKLIELSKKHKKIILATDPDREGESISYHVAYMLGYVKEHWPGFDLENSDNIRRIVFHEITPKALEEALANPGDLRVDLVKAQQARRILDRVVGYELSPLLWKKTGKNWLSAGRVQTVALRLIVEREKEIQKFNLEPYFQIFGNFKNGEEFRAKLISKNGEKYDVTTKIQLFAGDYEYTKTTIDTNKRDEIQKDLEGDTYAISTITEEVIQRFPPPPFTTSLMQQDSFQKFGFPSKLTMRLAQSLYEKGLITYHRTDSFNLSTQFVFRAKDFIEATYGKEYALEKPRGYRTKSKSAQEAHEAIRPTHLDKTPDKVNDDKKLSPQELKLYELIFNRAVATQMKAADVKQVKAIVKSGKGYEFEAEFLQVLFDGFMKVLWPDYTAKHQDKTTLKENEKIILNTLEPIEKQTKPPYRYNEASLIRTLEEKGIGRPSTYAAIISLIQDKHYIARESRYFEPTALGTGICDYLSAAFPQLFDLTFTAYMEDSLDAIANGEKEMITLLSDFYTPFEKELQVKKKDTDKLDINELLDEKCPNCDHQLTVKYGRFGKFFACSDYPKCKYIKPNLKFLPNHFCPEDKGRLVVRFTKARKRFYGCENYPKCTYVQWALNVPGATAEATEAKKKTAKKPAKATKKAPVKKVAKKTTKKTTKKASATKKK